MTLDDLERIQRLDARNDAHEIVIDFLRYGTWRKHSIDQIMTFALVAKLNLEAVGQEGEQVSHQFLSFEGRPANGNSRCARPVRAFYRFVRRGRSHDHIHKCTHRSEG